MSSRIDEPAIAQQSGSWIRETMERYGLSANSLAATAGVPSERIAQLASGADYPSPDEVDVIARAIARRSGAHWGKADGLRHRFALAAGYYSSGNRTIIPDGHPQATRSRRSPT